jgi:ribosomal protein S12
VKDFVRYHIVRGILDTAGVKVDQKAVQNMVLSFQKQNNNSQSYNNITIN